MSRSLAFYTVVRDFEKKYCAADDSDPVVDLVRGDVEIQRSPLSGDRAFGSAIMIRVDRPVPSGPVNQTWGIREF